MKWIFLLLCVMGAGITRAQDSSKHFEVSVFSGIGYNTYPNNSLVDLKTQQPVHGTFSIRPAVLMNNISLGLCYSQTRIVYHPKDSLRLTSEPRYSAGVFCNYRVRINRFIPYFGVNGGINRTYKQIDSSINNLGWGYYLGLQTGLKYRLVNSFYANVEISGNYIGETKNYQQSEWVEIKNNNYNTFDFQALIGLSIIF